MVFLRELSVPQSEADDDLIDLVFAFANTYTERSVREGYIAEQKQKDEAPSVRVMRSLGYSWKDVLEMGLQEKE